MLLKNILHHWISKKNHNKKNNKPQGALPLGRKGRCGFSAYVATVLCVLLGWGVVQVGLSFQSHDPSQRSQGFLTLAGGLVVTFAKEILDLITA